MPIHQAGQPVVSRVAGRYLPMSQDTIPIPPTVSITGLSALRYKAERSIKVRIVSSLSAAHSEFMRTNFVLQSNFVKFGLGGEEGRADKRIERVERIPHL